MWYNLCMHQGYTHDGRRRTSGTASGIGSSSCAGPTVACCMPRQRAPSRARRAARCDSEIRDNQTGLHTLLRHGRPCQEAVVYRTVRISQRPIGTEFDSKMIHIVWSVYSTVTLHFPAWTGF